MISDFITVVVPAYNAALYLKQALESIFSQTYRNFEIILVDDGSTDDTPIIAQQYGDAIRYIRQPNRGLSAARNTAIKNARAEVIALLDSDDLWKPQFLERMIYLLNIHPEAAGVYCGFQYINSKNEIIGRPSLKTVLPELFHETMVYEGNWLVPSAVMFRKQLAENVGLFDESLQSVQDWDLWISLSACNPFIGLPEALVKYRRHESNMSKDPELMLSDYYQLIKKRYGPDEGNFSTWSSSKRRAFSDYYRGAATSFYASGMMQQSVNNLLKFAELSPEYACSLSVWRGFVRAHIPDEYQFESVPKHDWATIQSSLIKLFDELAQRANHSVCLYGLYSRMKGFAFLALADEAGWAGEFNRAFDWFRIAVRSYHRLLFLRSFWGTIFRGFTTSILTSIQVSKSERISS